MKLIVSSRLVLANSRGQSLTQTLIAVAIMGMMMAAFASMTANQSRETNALSQKLASSDFQQLLVSSLANGSVCTYLMTLPGATPIDIASLVGATAPQMISVPLTGTPPTATLYASINTSVVPNVPGAIIAQQGQPPSAYSSSLTIDKIQLSVNPLSALPASYPATLTANWLVSFDSTKLVRALVPAATATTLTVTSTGMVTSCGSSVNKGATVELKCPIFTGGGLNAPCTPPSCPPYWTDSGVISSQYSAANNTYWGGYTSRYCTSTKAYSVIEPRCPIFYGGGLSSMCTPPPCPQGWFDLNVISTAYTAGNSTYWGGYSSRYCVL